MRRHSNKGKLASRITSGFPPPPPQKTMSDGAEPRCHQTRNLLRKSRCCVLEQISNAIIAWEEKRPDPLARQNKHRASYSLRRKRRECLQRQPRYLDGETGQIPQRITVSVTQVHCWRICPQRANPSKGTNAFARNPFNSA